MLLFSWKHQKYSENLIFSHVSLQTHHVYSTLKRRVNDQQQLAAVINAHIRQKTYLVPSSRDHIIGYNHSELYPTTNLHKNRKVLSFSTLILN